MNATEYNQWLDHATAAYPEIQSQFRDEYGDKGLQRNRIWLEALDKVPLQSATNAIDAMVRGTTERPKYGWSDLPKMVLSFAREQANAELARRYDEHKNDQKVKCLKCMDCRSGVVAIWNPWFVFDAQEQIGLCSSSQDVYVLWQSWRKAHGSRGDALRLTVLCNCDNPTAIRKRERLTEFNEGKSAPKDRHVPAVRDVYCDRFTIWQLGNPEEVL